MKILTSDNIKCIFCLQKIPEGLDSDICDYCNSIMNIRPDLRPKMEKHKELINEFFQNHPKYELTIPQAINFLLSDIYIATKYKNLGNVPKTIQSFLSGFNITGNMLVCSFIPIITEAVNYTPLRKIVAIEEVTKEQKSDLQIYWKRKYNYDIGSNWKYVFKLYFFQRGKFITTRFQQNTEGIFDFPSSVIENIYSIQTNTIDKAIITDTRMDVQDYTQLEFNLKLIDLENLHVFNHHYFPGKRLLNALYCVQVNVKRFQPRHKGQKKWWFHYGSLDQSYSAYLSEEMIFNALLMFVKKRAYLPQESSFYIHKKTSRTYNGEMTIGDIKIPIKIAFSKYKNDLTLIEQLTNFLPYGPGCKGYIHKFSNLIVGLKISKKANRDCKACYKLIDKGTICAIPKTIKGNFSLKWYHLDCSDINSARYVENKDLLN